MEDDVIVQDEPALPTESVAFRSPGDHAKARGKGPQRAVMLDPRPGATAPFETWQGMSTDR